jgi:mannan endo-1,4-beta-mannosidase
VIGAACAVLAIVLALVVQGAERTAQAVRPAPPRGRAALPTTPGSLPITPGSYIGLYRRAAPASYAGVTAFTATTGIKPRLVSYYSGWFEPFQAGFATTAARHGAVPLVQINPTGVSLPKIASGQYDTYLRSYAAAVRSYRHPVILSFGHEMNGDWYSWGYRHASPAAFVAAWRHIVTLFRAQGARNVTWLWTVNTIHARGGIPGPAPWWPGSSYVTWVGIDGYYYTPSERFAPLFGPTIVAVRALTGDPILIAETGAAPAAGQAAKIADLFAGIRTYGLLGFLWFDAIGHRDWRLNSPTAIAAFRREAKADN